MYQVSVKFKILFVYMLFFFSLVVSAEIYKWVDEKGVTHFSQFPPNSGQKSETVKTLRSVVNTKAAKGKFDVKQKLADQLRTSRLLSKGKKAEEKVEKLKTQKECIKLKERKESLSFRPRANKEDENGNIVRMTEEERQKDINEMKAEISKKCN
jgi:hypothetical protein